MRLFVVIKIFHLLREYRIDWLNDIVLRFKNCYLKQLMFNILQNMIKGYLFLCEKTFFEGNCLEMIWKIRFSGYLTFIVSNRIINNPTFHLVVIYCAWWGCIYLIIIIIRLIHLYFCHTINGCLVKIISNLLNL